MTRLIVEPDIWSRFPGLRVILVWADGIDNRTERPELIEELGRRMAAVRDGWSYPSAQAHPHIAAWRAASKRLGFSGKKFPSSIEALVRRVLSGRGIVPINPLVDLYNRVSLSHLVPAGGWDLDSLENGEGSPFSTPPPEKGESSPLSTPPSGHGDRVLRLALTDGGERFRALGSEETIGVEPGEAAYLVGREVVTRHFVWRQSELGKLTPATRRALLISECLEPVSDGIARSVADDLERGLAGHFGVEPRSAVLTAGADPPRFD